MIGSTVNWGGGMLLLQVLLAAVLAWSVLCRATRMNGDTRREVRWAMAFEGACVGLLGGAPFLPVLYPQSTVFDWMPGATPVPIWILFLLSILAVQLATAKYWRDGVPANLQQQPRAGAANAVMPLALAAITLVAILIQPPAVAAQQSEDGQLLALEKGEGLKCLNDDGCIVMTPQAFHALAELARAGAQPSTVNCRRGTST